MKNRVLVFFALLLSSLSSHGALIEYGFSGAITGLVEYDGVSDVNTNVVSSSLFGFDIKAGGSFSGSFRYDASAVESDYRANNPDRNSAVFQNAVLDFRFEVGDYTYVDQSPAGILDSLVLVNDSDTGYKDTFSVLSGNALDEYFSRAGIGFFNSTGEIFNDFSLPTSLNLDDFIGYGYFSSALLDRDSGDQLRFNGQVDTLVAKVDEPGSMILLSIGLLGLACRFRSSQARRALYA